MDFGKALDALKNNQRVARKKWNKSHLQYVQACVEIVDGKPAQFDAYLQLSTGSSLVPWSANQTDLLAEDWTIVE